MDAAYSKMKAIQCALHSSGRIYATSVPSAAPVLFGVQEAIDVKCILRLASDQTRAGCREAKQREAPRAKSNQELAQVGAMDKITKKKKPQ